MELLRVLDSAATGTVVISAHLQATEHQVNIFGQFMIITQTTIFNGPTGMAATIMTSISHLPPFREMSATTQTSYLSPPPSIGRNPYGMYQTMTNVGAMLQVIITAVRGIGVIHVITIIAADGIMIGAPFCSQEVMYKLGCLDVHLLHPMVLT